MTERCALCECLLNRSGEYATPSVQGRSYATEHHYVAERFFGRSKNRPGEERVAILEADPWGVEGQKDVFCYECHEEPLHNPVLLPEDVRRLAELVANRKLNENEKPSDRKQIAGRIQLLHEVIVAGLLALTNAENLQT